MAPAFCQGLRERDGPPPGGQSQAEKPGHNTCYVGSLHILYFLSPAATWLFKYYIRSLQASEQGLSILYCVSVLCYYDKFCKKAGNILELKIYSNDMTNQPSSLLRPQIFTMGWISQASTTTPEHLTWGSAMFSLPFKSNVQCLRGIPTMPIIS